MARPRKRSSSDKSVAVEIPRPPPSMFAPCPGSITSVTTILLSQQHNTSTTCQNSPKIGEFTGPIRDYRMSSAQEQREMQETGEGGPQDPQEKARVRRSKKPEIQLYRPGALRSLRSNSSSDLPPQSPESHTTKPDTVVEASDDRQKTDIPRRTSVKGRKERRNAKESVGGKGDDTGERDKRSAKEVDRLSPNKESDNNFGATYSSFKTEERPFSSKPQKERSHSQSDNYVASNVRPTKENRHPQPVRHSKETNPVPKSVVENRESKAEERITPPSIDDRGSGRKNPNMSNQTHHEHSEKKSSAEKMRPDNPAGRLFGKSLVIQNEKNAPERKPARREERRRGKPEKQPGTEAAAKPYNTEKHFPERSQHMNKSSAVQQAKLRNNSNNNEFYAWVPEIVEAKSDQKTSPEKPNTKREKSRFGKHSVITETSPQNDQPRGRANEKVAEGEGKARHTNRDKFEGTKSDNNKGNYEQPYSKKEESRGSKWTQKIQDKADSETLPDIESLKLYDTDSKSVQELAAKVDKLVCSKNMGKSPNFKKGRGWSDYHVETKNYLHADYKKGTLLEDSTSISTSETQEKGKTGNKNEGKVSPVSTAKKENLEKTPRAKSYLSARESRKKRGNSKTPSPGNHLSSQREELKVEVSPNTDSHERVVHLSQKNESNSSEHRKPHQGRGASEPPISKKAEESPPYPQKATVTIKNKSSRYHKPSGSLHGEKFASGKYDSEDDMMLHDAEDDWGREVDHDMIWCNQPDKKSGLQSWEDEKLFCRNRRVKHHSEGEDPCQRVDSPGRRGGLIQLPTTTSREASVPEPAVPRQAATQPTVVQRHLYNPNNPSKPVAVVPSARDLPVTRETQRGSSWGSSGEAASGSSLPQGGQATEYHMEGSSTKVDPSLLYSISKGEMDISYYVSSNQLPVEFRRIMDIRMHLQGCYQQLLVSDIRLCQEKNIEGSLWKTLYYTIIEKLREYINREATLKERSLATLLMLVEEGLRYLQDLLEALQQEYGFTLEDYLEEEGEVRGRVRMALLSAQKLLLSLGDLARYKEQYNASPNYNIAKKWYQMALQVYPRNGRPFNQLAIIAFSQKRPLDVVYYYMRSLTASNPIMSARDALVAMFDDIRKRYVSVQQSEPHPEGTRSSLGRSLSHEGLRQELWIRPDSGVTNCRTLSSSNNEDTTDKDDDLKKIPVEQLMKQFLAGYLHCHGMLFSGVGLDGFRDCCFNMLQEFSVLLRASPPRLSTNHLLQIMAINMYAITNTELKGECCFTAVLYCIVL
ncbi:Telomerase-binding protein EST1A [Portunus trituberculatus]|uniref:Telomerase-binding protein EST1A n=1 Tax=Portunus trituberculatus TaxID=210409 RepID=A0A5B7F0H0_PORTR|nr:Telomerase-binding protein EST1A [Portunus trituberculatus]